MFNIRDCKGIRCPINPYAAMVDTVNFPGHCNDTVNFTYLHKEKYILLCDLFIGATSLIIPCLYSSMSHPLSPLLKASVTVPGLHLSTAFC